MKEKDKTEVLEEIDKYVISACITLLASFAVIFSVNKEAIWFVYAVSVVSIFFLLLTLLLSIWHKYRTFLRNTIYQERHKQWTEESKGLIKELLDNTEETVKAEIKSWCFDHIEELKGKTKEQISSLIGERSKEADYIKRNEKMIENVSYSMAKKHEEYYKEAFGPLKENWPKSKLLVDKLAKNFRYHLFVVGLVTFFVALSLKLFI